MMPRMYIEGTKQVERPESRRTVFADGGSNETYRPRRDVELSHWIPNRTPKAFKADTSTEICMNFVAAGKANYDLVVNNHADVDGVLSIFTLLHPATALAHRETLVSAAAMGDFWGWGEPDAQVLFQSLTEQIDTLTDANADPQVVFDRCLAHISTLIEAGFEDLDIASTLAPLSTSLRWVEDGTIARHEYHQRFVHYALPASICEARLDAALRVPKFNAMISDDVLFWPQARAKWDREKVQLVSIEAADGWYYDLWYPGYSWADTPDSWRAPGLTSKGESVTLSFAPLREAARELQLREREGVTWRLETEPSIFASTIGRGFPVMLSAVAADGPVPSSSNPELVARRLARVFAA